MKSDTMRSALDGHSGGWKSSVMGKQMGLAKTTACLIDSAHSTKMELQCLVRRDVQYLSKRRCLFSDAPYRPWNFVDVAPDPVRAAQFTPMDKKEIAVQCMACEFSAIPINTDNAVCESRGVYHREGGWPRDINPQEADQTARFRKKVEKDDAYTTALLNLGQTMEHYIKQNNAINIYEEYFLDAPDLARPDHNPLRTIHVLKDPSRGQRSITGFSFSPDGGTRVAAAYCQPFWQSLFASRHNDSYVWNLERAYEPEVAIQSTEQCQCLAYNPRDQQILAAGTTNGAVGVWDVRRSQGPVEFSPTDVAHRESVKSVFWSNSKAGGEFFSASPDGQVLWWDMRKLTTPVDALILDSERCNDPQLDRALSASCMEYDPSMPNKFFTGTDQGAVLFCNRRARTTAERIMCVYEAHVGPVRTLHRHPQLPKIFCTIGDWSANIWAEDVRESPILSLKSPNVQFLCGAWSYTRPSVLFTAAADGSIYVWDILVQRSSPVLNFQIDDTPVVSMTTQENGKLMAVGSQNGLLSIIRISDNLGSVNRNDRATLNTLVDRETRREKMLESRTKDPKGKDKKPVVARPATPTAKTSPPASPTLPPAGGAGVPVNTTFQLEPPADQIDNANAGHLVTTPSQEVSVDETLQSAQDAFFEIINQDIASRRPTVIPERVVSMLEDHA